jgi:hypothetical protein
MFSSEWRTSAQPEGKRSYGGPPVTDEASAEPPYSLRRCSERCRGRNLTRLGLHVVHSIEALRQHSTALLKHSRKLREDAGEARARSAKIREAAQRAQLSTCNRLAHAEVVLRRQDRATTSST